MKLHKRVFPCQKAEVDLRAVLLDWLERHPQLTWAEAVRCLAGIIHSWSARPVQEERHGNKDTRTDEE